MSIRGWQKNESTLTLADGRHVVFAIEEILAGFKAGLQLIELPECTLVRDQGPEEPDMPGQLTGVVIDVAMDDLLAHIISRTRRRNWHSF